MFRARPRRTPQIPHGAIVTKPLKPTKTSALFLFITVNRPGGLRAGGGMEVTVKEAG